MPLKLRLELYIQQCGVSQAFISDAVGLPRETLNRFLRGKRQLPRCWIKPLDGFLSQRGY